MLFYVQVLPSQISNMFFNKAVRFNGIPGSITSDQVIEFVLFLAILVEANGHNLNFTIAYHPQIDGQTEVVNRSLGNMLQALVGENPK